MAALIVGCVLAACTASDPRDGSESDGSVMAAADSAVMLSPDADLNPEHDASPPPESDAGPTPNADAGLAPDADVSPPPPSCAVNDVFERNGCFGCHGENADLNGGGVHLTPERLEESLVGVASKSPGCAEHALVDVENPAASILVHSLAPDRHVGELSEACRPMPMPLGGAVTLSDDDVDCVEQWIETLEPPEVEQPDVTFAAPAVTVLTRVKYLLDGGALSAAELESASGPDGELLQAEFEALIATWMAGDRFRAKRRQFLELHLQQTPSDINYFNQFRNTRTNSLAPVRDALNQSLIRTAERIIDDDEDFRPSSQPTPGRSPP